MDIMQLGAQLLQSKLGGDGESGDMMTALSGLIGGENGIDIAGLVSKMQGDGGLAELASSWLGDGENAAISGDQVRELLGSEKIAEFAASLNVDEDTAVSGLSDMLPEVVDKSSAGGSILDSVGGIGGLMEMAGKLMK